MPIKKYFYVLRPLLSVRWLELYGEPAPIGLSNLLSLVTDEGLHSEINALLVRRMTAQEKEVAPPIQRLDDFIESELARLDLSDRPFGLERTANMEDPNGVFRQTVVDAWS